MRNFHMMPLGEQNLNRPHTQTFTFQRTNAKRERCGVDLQESNDFLKIQFDDQQMLVAELLYQLQCDHQLEGNWNSPVKSPIAGLLVGTYGLPAF